MEDLYRQWNQRVTGNQTAVRKNRSTKHLVSNAKITKLFIQRQGHEFSPIDSTNFVGYQPFKRPKYVKAIIL